MSLPWSDPAGVAAAFHAAHEQRYGHRLDLPLELVNLRIALDVAVAPPVAGALRTLVDVAAPGGAAAPVHLRAALRPGQVLAGPAIVCDATATTHIDRGWHGEADRYGNLHLVRAVHA